MELKEVLDLIAIRTYVVESRANPAFERGQIRDLDGLLILLDKKILGILLGDEFKDYIDFKNVRAAIEDVARITNIKSGLRK